MSIRFHIIASLFLLFLLPNPLWSADIDENVFPFNGQCGPGNPVSQGIQIKPVPPQALDVRGPEAVSQGSQYTAIGGDGSYAWSISCGVIDQTGKVGSISGCCGTGTVTVRDGSGASDFMDVRMPSGSWVYAGEVGNFASYCNDYGMPASAVFYSSGKKYSATMYFGQSTVEACSTNGLSIGGSGGFFGADGNKVNSLPHITEPYPTAQPCGNTPCGGYQGYGACGVCGSCSRIPNPRICYYTNHYSISEWRCQ